MRNIKALHIKQDESTEEVTIIGVALKEGEDIYVIFIDPEGNVDGDDAEKFSNCERLG